LYHGIFILIYPKQLIERNVSRLRLHAHTLNVEAAAWLKGGSHVCDQTPCEHEHGQNEVHALLFANGYNGGGPSARLFG